jgi:hypothetical protein
MKNGLTIITLLLLLAPGLPAQPAPPIVADTARQIQITSKFVSIPDEAARNLGLLPAKGQTTPRVPSMFAPGSETAKALFKGLDSTPGIELISAPSVSVRSGHHALVQIEREFRYATAYEAQAAPGSLIPKDFTTEDVGVRLEVEPTLHPEGGVIDLNLVTTLTEYEGFINFADSKTAPPKSQSTGNHWFQQPVFTNTSVPLATGLRDGDYLLIGGFPRSDRQFDPQAKPEPPKGEAPAHLFILLSAVEIDVNGSPAGLQGPKTLISVEHFSLPRAKLPPGLVDLDTAPTAVHEKQTIAAARDLLLNDPDVKSTVDQTRVIPSGASYYFHPKEVTQFLALEIRPKTEKGSPHISLRTSAVALRRNGDQTTGHELAQSENTLEDGQTFVRALSLTPEDPLIHLTFYTCKFADTTPAAPSEPAPLKAVPVPGKPGFVTSPYAPEKGYVDLTGFPPGTQVKCPYTGKVFLVP